MNTRSLSRARVALPYRNRSRCQVEELDRRLPPGSLLGPFGLAAWELGVPAPAFGAWEPARTSEQGHTASLRLIVLPGEAFDGTAYRGQDDLATSTGIAAGRGETTSFTTGILPEELFSRDALDAAAALGAVLNAGYAGTQVSSLELRSDPVPAVTSPAQSDSSEVDLLTRMLLAGLDQMGGLAARPGPATQANGYGQVPLYFEANAGQTDSQVRFLSRGAGHTLFLTPREAVLRMQRTGETTDAAGFDTPTAEGLVVRMEFAGANPDVAVTGLARLAGNVNYFTGSDPGRWQTNVATFGRVEYAQLYAGIDLVWYGNAQGQLEYDFVVAPGADPSAIGFQFHGVDRLEVDAQGDLLLHTPFGALRQPRPVTYQEVDGVRREISSGYTLSGQHAGFTLGAYDVSLPVVIDPVLTYSTFLGGSGGEDGYSIAVDAAGSAYVAGATDSTDFPTTAGAFQPMPRGFQDAFVAKLNPDGTALEYASYLGGDLNDRANSIAVDGGGSAYVAGRTSSLNFPTTAGVLQATHRGGVYEAFVTKINPTGGSLTWSTYLGGGGNDAAFGVALDAAGGVVVVGGTLSEDFPVTPTAFQFFNRVTDSFMSRLLPNASDVSYSTYFGTSGGFERANAVAVDGAGMVYVGGQTREADFPTSLGSVQPNFGGGLGDGYLIKFDPRRSGEASLIYATYVGGGGDDRVHGVALDAGGNAYLTGVTDSLNFPTVNAFQPAFGGGEVFDAFVMKVAPDGGSHVYSTYLGGAGAERGNAIAVNAAGEAYVTGATASADFPTLNPIQPALAGLADAFVTRFSAAGDTLVWSTYLGGTFDDNVSFSDTTNQGGIALDAAGNVYLVGRTESADFPTLNPLQPVFGGEADAFVAKISEAAAGVLFCFLFSPDAATVGAGTPLTLTVSAVDGFFNPVLDYAGEVMFFTTDSLGTVPPNYTYQPADMGVHTFTDGFVFLTPGQHMVFVFDTATFTVYGIAVVDVV